MQNPSDSINLAYDDSGLGRPILLIHGFPLCRAMWKPQMEPLSRAGFRVITPDLRGFGESPVGTTSVTMDLYADDLVRLLDRLEIDRAIIGGMSMGGYVLLNLLERFSDRVAHPLFLVTRAAADDSTGKEKRNHLIREVAGGHPDKVAEAFESVLFGPKTAFNRPELVAEVRTWMRGTDPAGLTGGLQAMRDRRDYVGLLPGFPQKALVVGAEYDLAVPVEHSRLLDRGLPDSRFCLVSGAGHMANMEQPEAFNRCLLDFLRELPGA